MIAASEDAVPASSVPDFEAEEADCSKLVQKLDDGSKKVLNNLVKNALKTQQENIKEK